MTDATHFPARPLRRLVRRLRLGLAGQHGATGRLALRVPAVRGEAA